MIIDFIKYHWFNIERPEPIKPTEPRKFYVPKDKVRLLLRKLDIATSSPENERAVSTHDFWSYAFKICPEIPKKVKVTFIYIGHHTTPYFEEVFKDE